MIRALGALLRTWRRKPRASGDDPIVVTWLGVVTAVNPARAGMIRTLLDSVSSLICKPRASGDDPRRSSGQDSRCS